ncbi:MAG TPA: hypothetical protein VGB84_05630, partial [Arachidicoccus sp.]
MSVKEQRIQYLLEAYTKRTHTQAELNELFGYIHEAKSDEILYAFMAEHYRQLPQVPGLAEPDWEQMFSYITSRPSLVEAQMHKLVYIHWLRYTAVAMVVLALGIGAYIYMARQKPQPGVSTEVLNINVAPGSNKAVLTLSDGSTVLLDSSGQKLIQQGNTAIKQQG